MANTKQKKIFDAGSPGFLYTVIVSVLTIFAASGVSFPDSPEQIAGQFTTLLSTGGFYAVLGVVATSVAFPLWNAYKKKQFNFQGIFSSTLTWVAIANIAFAGLALTGFTLPEGAVDALVAAVLAKDWGAIISMLFTTILPTVVRFIKDKKQTT
jgi:hypothetical protein